MGGSIYSIEPVGISLRFLDILVSTGILLGRSFLSVLRQGVVAYSLVDIRM